MDQPLYQKIFNDLKAAIADGSLPVDSQVPTEKELSAKYQVSRITSKRALTELEQLGLIYRVRGKGSLLRPQLVWNSMQCFLKIVVFYSYCLFCQIFRR